MGWLENAVGYISKSEEDRKGRYVCSKALMRKEDGTPGFHDGRAIHILDGVDRRHCVRDLVR